jgi:hypothetical protein
MRIVGDYLAEGALGQGNNSSIDLFARSAFNRYYYAVYLIVNESISLINPTWSKMNHADLPEVLKGKVIKTIKDDIKRKIKNDVIPYHIGENIKQKVIHSANELSNLLDEAYRIRVIADYQPDIKVEIRSGTFLLDGEKISVAKMWKNTAETHTNSLIKAYKDVGLI